MLSRVTDMAELITPYIFFTGKGGVGKTSFSCAFAVKMADEEKKSFDCEYRSRLYCINPEKWHHIKEMLFGLFESYNPKN